MSAFVLGTDVWALAEASDRRFRRVTAAVSIPFLLFAILIHFFEITGEERGGGRITDDRYVSLVPDAEEAEVTEEPAPAEENQPEPPKEEAKAEPVKPKQEAPKQPPQPTQQELQQAARQVAEKTGVMAFADQLAEMRDNSLSGFDASRQLTTDIVSAKSGTGASGGGSASQSFASSAASGSGGIGATGIAEQRRQQSGAGLGQRRTTKVESPVGFGRDLSKPGQNGDQPVAGRSLEEIQLVMDRNQSSMYEMYRRALLQNASLSGTIKLRITIDPSGAVSNCVVVSSELGDPDLERKVVLKVMSYRFQPKSIPPFTVAEYPIKFVAPNR